MKTLKLKISEMGSAHCVGVIRNTIAKQDGAAIENIRLNDKLARK